MFYEGADIPYPLPDLTDIVITVQFSESNDLPLCGKQVSGYYLEKKGLSCPVPSVKHPVLTVSYIPVYALEDMAVFSQQ